jgi:Family of unknown function (DUF5336)
MSGYGVPPGSSPAASRSPRSGSAVPMLDLVGAGLAVLAFIFAFLPWAGPNVDVEGVDAETASGWELALPTAATVLLLVAAVLVIAPLLASSRSTDDSASPVPALLAVLAFILYLVYVIVGGKLLGTELERKIGVWLGLIAGLATAAVLVFSWLQKSGRAAKRPSPAASYGGPGSGGPGSGGPGAPGGQWGGQQQPSTPSYGQQGGGYGQQPSYGQQQPSGYPGAQPTPPVQQPPSSPSYGQGGGYGGQSGSPYGGAGTSGPSTGGTPAQGGGYGGGSGGQDYPPPSGYPSQGQGYPSQGGGSDYPR